MELTWDNARMWAEKQNETSSNRSITWDWDCNFKLDYDGDILKIESRFYPPSYQKDNTWDGKLRVMFLGECVQEKTFNCKDLDSLKKQVESFTKHYLSIIKSKIK